MSMFGCSFSKSATVFFISGEFPIQEKNVTVVGSVGSLTAPSPAPFLLAGLSVPDDPSPLPQPASAALAARRRAATAVVERILLILMDLLLWSADAAPGRPRRTGRGPPTGMQIVWLRASIS